MENQVEKNMEREMEAGVIKGLKMDPSMQMVPTLGPKVCKSRVQKVLTLMTLHDLSLFGMYAVNNDIQNFSDKSSSSLLK